MGRSWLKPPSDSPEGRRRRQAPVVNRLAASCSALRLDRRSYDCIGCPSAPTRRGDVVGKFNCSVTIQRPIEEVFALLTDPTRSPEWSKHSIRGELLTEGPPRIGSRRRTVVKGFAGIGTMESVFEVTEIDPLRAVALKQVSASLAARGWTGRGS